MGRNANDVIRSLPAVRRRKIEKRARLLIEEEMTLRELRKSRAMTQAAIAKAMKIAQKQVSEVESRSDMYVSTVRRQVEAMGGKLLLVVELPGKNPVVLSGLGDFAAR
jgi:DNA-binding XRE family transcriptional regulator